MEKGGEKRERVKKGEKAPRNMQPTSDRASRSQSRKRGERIGEKGELGGKKKRGIVRFTALQREKKSAVAKKRKKASEKKRGRREGKTTITS